MGYKSTEGAHGSLCVLNDVCFYSLAESRWLPADETPSSPLAPHSLVPRARYAHLSSVSSDMLFIIGGQDLENGWLDDIHVYNLYLRSWVHRSDYPRHCGTYRSVALSSPLCVRNPSSEPAPAPASRFRSETTPSVLPVTPPDTFLQLPYSVPPSSSLPSEIFLYSNYNVGFCLSFLFVLFVAPVCSPLSCSSRTSSANWKYSLHNLLHRSRSRTGLLP
jgi:leucine-zipper-like transcriptional regulator 1